MPSEPTASYQPTSFTRAELKKVGVTVLDEQKPDLRCDRCGERWSPVKSGESFPRGYWLCPRGCNDIERDEGTGD